MKLIVFLFLLSFTNSCNQKEWNDRSDGKKPPSVGPDKGNNEQNNELNEKNGKAFCELYDVIDACTQKTSIEKIELCLENDVASLIETKLGEKKLEVSSAEKKAEMDSSTGTLNQCLSDETDLGKYRNCYLTHINKVKSIIGCS